MATAQAAKRGRTPFVPKETRVTAQRVLDALLRPDRPGKVPRRMAAPPAHARAKAATADAPRAAEASRTAPPAPQSQQAPRPVSLADLPRLAAKIPSFSTGGVAADRASGSPAASGSYLYETGEDVHVITKNSKPVAAASEMAPSAARGGVGGGPSAATPRAASGRTPSLAGGGGRGVGAAAGAAGGTASGPTEITGTLKLTGVEGLSSWITRVEGRLKSNV